MAMTGMRQMTTGLGLVQRTPPERILREGVPSLLARVPVEHRDEAIELAHWGYGAAAGAAFGLLPQAIRRNVWAGPAYGLAIWALFEGAVAPLLGLNRAPDRTATERACIAVDHLLYGLVVAARPRRV